MIEYFGKIMYNEFILIVEIAKIFAILIEEKRRIEKENHDEIWLF